MPCLSEHALDNEVAKDSSLADNLEICDLRGQHGHCHILNRYENMFSLDNVRFNYARSPLLVLPCADFMGHQQCIHSSDHSVIVLANNNDLSFDDVCCSTWDKSFGLRRSFWKCGGEVINLVVSGSGHRGKRTTLHYRGCGSPALTFLDSGQKLYDFWLVLELNPARQH